MCSKIEGKLIKTINEVTRNNDRRPYKVLQMLTCGKGFIHELSGELISCVEGAIDGAKCTALKLLDTAGKYAKTYYAVDYDLARKYKVGAQVRIFAIPIAKLNGMRAIVIYEATAEQKQREYEQIGEVRLISIADYSNHDWKIGNITADVALRTYVTKSGLPGFKYTIAVA